MRFLNKKHNHLLTLLGQSLHFQYIDDFGGLALEMMGEEDSDSDEEDFRESRSYAAELFRACIAALKQAGPGCHKEVFGR